MIDLRKIDIWYSNNFAKVSREHKKLKNVFSKTQEKKNRKKIEKIIETETTIITSRLNKFHKTNYNSLFWQKIIQKWKQLKYHNQKKKELNLMAPMNVLCVHAVLRHAQVIGGMEINT